MSHIESLMTDFKKDTLNHIMSFNVNTDRRLYQPLYQSYKDLQLEERLQTIIPFVLKYLDQGVIVCLFELSTEMREEITFRLLKNKGFSFLNFPYNMSGDGCFEYLIIYPKNVSLFNINHLPYTTSGEFVLDYERPGIEYDKIGERRKGDLTRKENKKYMELTGGELFEKSFVSFTVKNLKNGFKYHVFLTHLGLGMKQKLWQSEILVNQASKITDSVPIIILGDFNAFDFAGGSFLQQYQVFKKSGFEPGIPMDTNTFKSYPYDIGFKLSGENLEKYLSFTKMHPKEVTKEISEEFKDFCEEMVKGKHLKEIKPVALDNVFFKNCEIETELKDCTSDHLAVIVKIIL